MALKKWPVNAAEFLSMKRKLISTAGLYLKKFKFFSFCARAAVFVLAYWRWANLPADVKNQTEQVFVVPQGQSTGAIAQRLQREKLIKSALVFRLLVEQKGLSN